MTLMVNYNILLGNKIGEGNKMAEEGTNNFKGIVSCFGEFDETGCVTYICDNLVRQ